MTASGALLREVGTTNKTHLYDYSRAVCEKTGMILKVHQSNYKVIGFTEDVPVSELVQLERIMTSRHVRSGERQPYRPETLRHTF